MTRVILAVFVSRAEEPAARSTQRTIPTFKLPVPNYFGMSKGGTRGYVTTGGTEGNFASLWWSKRFLINSLLNKLIETGAGVIVITHYARILRYLNKLDKVHVMSKGKIIKTRIFPSWTA